MNITAAELAGILNGTVEGDAHILVHKPARIEDAEPGSLTFLANPKYEEFAYRTQASILLVNNAFQPQKPLSCTLIRVSDVYAAMALLAEKFEAKTEVVLRVSDKASISADSKMGAKVSIAEFVVVEPDCTIEDGVCLDAFVFIGRGSQIGQDTHLYPGVKVHAGTQIGKRVIIHANTVVGSDGFGFVKQNGTFTKMKQLGNVVIEDDVEIGANVVIDRASLGSTIIRQGAKLDNLIQIAHNVEIGKNTAIAAQAGIAGSSRVGNDVLIGGQAGIVGHIHVADGTQIQAQSGVTKASEPGARLYGSPAMDYTNYLRSYAAFKNLPAVSAMLQQLQRKIQELEKEVRHLLGK